MIDFRHRPRSRAEVRVLMASHDRVKAPSFEAVRDSVARLGPEDKLRLWRLLEAEIGLADEAVLEQDPEIQSEIREARAAYDAGDYERASWSRFSLSQAMRGVDDEDDLYSFDDLVEAY